MKRDHRPYFIKKLHLGFQQFYTRHFIEPQLESLGKDALFIKPWHVDIFGAPIKIGDYAMLVATPDKKIRLSIWAQQEAHHHRQLLFSLPGRPYRLRR